MALAIVSFVVLFLLIVSGGLLLFYRSAPLQRLSDAVTPGVRKGDLLETIQQTGFSIGGMVQRLETVVPKSQSNVSQTERRLMRAGYRESAAVGIFYGVKVLVPLALFVVALGFHISDDLNPILGYGVVLAAGFMLPDFWLSRRIKARQKEIRLALPDALDFLVICIEAGLSMDQATSRTAQELRVSRPALSDELEIVVLEQRAGRLRSDAWRQFAERTGVDTVSVLASVLVQSEQIGASVAKTLRVHSDTLRSQRTQQVEEQAAKTTVKLVFPLVLLIFPALFVVVLGPEAILLAQSFSTGFGQ